ncbi:MAG: radical SAM protein, partial [Sulfobacillus sp.]
MNIELKPLGVRCNIQCQYCYQNPQRDAGNIADNYDLEKIKAVIAQEGGPFSLFGGKPLLMPECDLERLWVWGLEKFGSNSVQTNGTLFSDSHIHLFKKYIVSVGLSVDGPGALNDVRWAGTLEQTRKSTAKTHAAIELLCREGIFPGLIVTLHRGNATGEKLPALLDWFRYLERIGVWKVRLHLLEAETPDIREKYRLFDTENLTALRAMLAFETEYMTTLQFDLFRDKRNLLRGEDEKSPCVWVGCDPYTTKAVHGIEGDGQHSNCSRTCKEGIDFVKSDAQGFERYMALYHTPQEEGGCRDCRFFLV